MTHSEIFTAVKRSEAKLLEELKRLADDYEKAKATALTTAGQRLSALQVECGALGHMLGKPQQPDRTDPIAAKPSCVVCGFKP